jgi:hypothetical protein
MLGTGLEVDKQIRILYTILSGKRRGIYKDNWLIFYFARIDECGSAFSIISTLTVARVWKFMDPSIKADDLPILSRPAVPMPIDVNPDTTRMSELSPAEREELKFLRDEWKNRNREYEKQQSAIENLHTLIHETVSRSYYTYLIKRDTLHDMLTALKQRVAPSDHARELELISQYQKLKKAPRSQNLDNWIKQWETTYTDCKEFDLPDVAKTRVLYDFLNANQETAADFAGIWIVRIQEREQTGEEIPDLYKILEYFQNHMRVRIAHKAQISHSAFPSSFQGQKLDLNKEENQKNKEKKEENKEDKPCLCGEVHRFRACRYLIESLRPTDWKPDPSIRKRIDEKLQRHTYLRETVERI